MVNEARKECGETVATRVYIARIKNELERGLRNFRGSKFEQYHLRKSSYARESGYPRCRSVESCSSFTAGRVMAMKAPD